MAENLPNPTIRLSKASRREFARASGGDGAEPADGGQRDPGEQRGSPQSSVHGRKLQERPGLFLRREFRPVFELDRELGPGSEVMVPTDESIQWRNLKQDLRRAVYSGRIGSDAPIIHLDGAGA